MSDAFVGQVQPFAFNFAPRNWAQCNGQILAVNQNQALFALIGTTYGGNGISTFGLPNLQSRVPMHYGTFGSNTYTLGETGGAETVGLNISTMPSHNHNFMGSSQDGNSVIPADGVALAKVSGGATPNNFYASNATTQPLNSASITMTGGNQPHENLQPYLVINWCICQFGVFPSRN